MMTSRRSRKRGFTLLEMLVAMLLLGLLAGLVFGGIQVATRSWQKVTRQSEQDSEAFLLQSFLRHLLEQMNSQQLRDQDLVLQVAVHGKDNQLLFLAPRSRDSETLAWFSLGLEQTTADDGKLVLRTLSFALPDNHQIDWRDIELQFQQQAATPHSALLSYGVSSLQIEYLPKEHDTTPQWQPDWLQQEQLPELIRLRFVPTATSQQKEVELVVMLRDSRYVVKDSF